MPQGKRHLPTPHLFISVWCCQMVPIGVLGLLLCVRLCGGEWWFGGLRLVGGGGRCAGRVEVKHDGEWGSVCVYDFDWEAQWATVVCRQLGCGSVARASVFAPFGEATGRIWLQPFFCRGSEKRLQDCPHFGWGQHFCGHRFDVGVTCTGEEGGPNSRAGWDTRMSPLPGHPEAGAPVQRRDAGARWGTTTGTWRTPRWSWVGVCQDGVDIKVAQVVCRALGCGEALAVPGAGRFEGRTGPLREWGFNCTGTEPLLTSCTPRPPRGQDCSGHATVICSRKHLGTPGGCWGVPTLSPPNPNAPFAAAYTGFRLAGNSSGCAGRVEVEAGGTWGSLCATGWDLPDAHVLCRHLGCGPSAPTVPPGGSFGGGDGRLRPDAFGCGGSERHPGECPMAGLGEPPCPPGHAAAVNCSGGYGRENSLRGLLGRPKKRVPKLFWDSPKAGSGGRGAVLGRREGCAPTAPPGML
uniref:SRCR domain-containing protein n=1 Tax=Calidris pygmaea TaxID=425635 RepID=A0A8C3J616_9CHAR